MFNELDRLSNQFFKDSEDFINKMKKRSVSMTAKTMQFVLVYQDEDRCKTCFLDHGALVKKVKELGLFKKRWMYNHRVYDQKFEDVMDNMTIEYTPFQQESLTAFTNGAKIFRIT
jgi:hypothetical protein